MGPNQQSMSEPLCHSYCSSLQLLLDLDIRFMKNLDLYTDEAVAISLQYQYVWLNGQVQS